MIKNTKVSEPQLRSHKNIWSPIVKKASVISGENRGLQGEKKQKGKKNETREKEKTNL
jgi:hypothetical protein